MSAYYRIVCAARGEWIDPEIICGDTKLVSDEVEGGLHDETRENSDWIDVTHDVIDAFNERFGDVPLEGGGSLAIVLHVARGEGGAAVVGRKEWV